MELTTTEEREMTSKTPTENMVRISLIFTRLIDDGLTPEQSVENISRHLGISKQSVLHSVKMVQEC